MSTVSSSDKLTGRAAWRRRAGVESVLVRSKGEPVLGNAVVFTLTESGGGRVSGWVVCSFVSPPFSICAPLGKRISRGFGCAALNMVVDKQGQFQLSTMRCIASLSQSGSHWSGAPDSEPPRTNFALGYHTLVSRSVVLCAEFVVRALKRNSSSYFFEPKSTRDDVKDMCRCGTRL